MTIDIHEIVGHYAKIAEYLFTNISMGEWQPPRLTDPISWDDIKRLCQIRSDIEKRGSKLRKQGVANTYPELHGLYEQFEAEFGGYVI